MRKFTERHIEEDCSELKGDHENGLFFGCTFRKLNDLSLKNCDLNGSQFKTEGIRDALGFTVTLDCHSYKGVELSEDLFDLQLLLLYQTLGNDEKRKKLLDVVGKERAERFLRIMSHLE